MIILSGTANATLSEMVAKNLKRQLGDADVRRFTDNEIYVEVKDNVRGEDVFVIQPTSCPANDHIMELLIVLDALRRGSAKRITAVIPYFGYARQDRRVRSARVAITARVVADMMASVGIGRLLTVDLHADQIQGFFDIPTDNLVARFELINEIKKLSLQNLVIGAPDIGSIKLSKVCADMLKTDFIIIDKDYFKIKVENLYFSYYISHENL